MIVIINDQNHVVVISLGNLSVYLSTYLSVFSDASLPPEAPHMRMATATDLPPLPVQILSPCFFNPSPSTSASFTQVVLLDAIFLSSKRLSSLVQNLNLTQIMFFFHKLFPLRHFSVVKPSQRIHSFSPIPPLHKALHLHSFLSRIAHTRIHIVFTVQSFHMVL